MDRRYPKYGYNPQAAQRYDPQKVMETIDMVGRTLPGMNDTLLEMNKNVLDTYNLVNDIHGRVMRQS